MLQLSSIATPVRREAIVGSAAAVAALALLVLGFPSTATAAPRAKANGRAAVMHHKLDAEVTRRKAANPTARSSVIVTLVPGADLPTVFKPFARAGKLESINGHVLDLPNGLIRRLEAHPEIFDVHSNRAIRRHNYRTSITVGSRALHRSLGLTGAGIGIAVIDSGISAWHDDLTNRSTELYPNGDQRVSAFVDFVNRRTQPYDDEGHGTHVAGIIAGNGYDSNGDKAGAAPDASLVVLKVLDANGGGTISSIIEAIDWVLANRVRYNIRVVNMSVGASISESYMTDPLTLAAKRAVDAGVVVVGAAGNRGRNALGQTQYGGITAPGNAPWVLTVGASSTNGTLDRGDDTIAGFSSRGPSYLDYGAKPDLVAPGHGTVSLADPLGTFYTTKAQYGVDGVLNTPYKPYLILSGTSMAAPVVAGTAALMLQANPTLTPNAVKAILQYTAQAHPDYDALTEGAGFLNAVGAVRLAQFFAIAQPGQPLPLQQMWSKQILWGNHLLSGGVLDPSANAYAAGTTWGVAATDGGDNIVWGTSDGDDNIVWGTSGDDDNIVWGTSGDDNIVWGTGDDDNIVWGTGDDDNIVWGTDGHDNIVWGTGDDDNIVWGTGDDDNIVWGTDGHDNIVWGTAVDGQIVWSSGDAVSPITWDALFRLTDEQIFVILAGVPPVVIVLADPVAAATEPMAVVSEPVAVVTEPPAIVTEPVATTTTTATEPIATTSTSVTTTRTPSVKRKSKKSLGF